MSGSDIGGKGECGNDVEVGCGIGSRDERSVVKDVKVEVDVRIDENAGWGINIIVSAGICRYAYVKGNIW